MRSKQLVKIPYGTIEEREVIDKHGEKVMMKMVWTKQNRWLPAKIKGVKHPNGYLSHKLPELEVLVSDIMGEVKMVGGVPRTAAYLILAAIRKKAVAGDVRAAELLLDRGYGKAKQEINVNKRVLQVIKIAGKEIEF